MRHPLTGAPLNYSIQTREQWDEMIACAAVVSKRMSWSVGIWLDVSTWGLQFFAGSGALKGRGGFRALIRLTPWQEVRPEVSEAVWERYHREHMLFVATRGNARVTAGDVSYEEDFNTAAATPEVALSTDSAARRMARGVAEMGGALRPDPDEAPEPTPRKRKKTGGPAPSVEEPF